jgi:membrane-bound lytic murein transglycosylase F
MTAKQDLGRLFAMLHSARKPTRWLGGIALGVLFAAVALPALLPACTPLEDNKLARVKSAGELTVLTRRSPSTYFETPDGPSGFEYDLMRAFADSLGVRLKVVVADRYPDVLSRLEQGDADMASAGIRKNAETLGRFLFSPPYQEIVQQVVCRQGTRAPTELRDLVGRQIDVHGGTPHAQRLQELQKTYKSLKWTEVDDKDTEELLQQVWEGFLEITIADSHTIALNRQFFPELQIALNVSPAEPLMWAFPMTDDHSLVDAASQFLTRYRAAGELDHLLDRYFGPASRSSYVNLTVYHARVASRLPEFQGLFEFAGREVSIDWRLLAAMSYQESYWDPKAESPTGVRGMMMLTDDTAKQVGVKDTFDAEQSVLGGARYLRDLYDRMEYIPVPERVWFALAAYNVGVSHLEDARILTQRHGKDPNKWSVVATYLPLLEQPNWYNRVRYGFARGTEPVIFVNRIRTYYDVLVKLDEEQRMRAKSDALKLKLPAI